MDSVRVWEVALTVPVAIVLLAVAEGSPSVLKPLTENSLIVAHSPLSNIQAAELPSEFPWRGPFRRGVDRCIPRGPRENRCARTCGFQPASAREEMPM